MGTPEPRDPSRRSRRFPSFVDDLPLTRAALEFAAQQHGDQRRDADGAPFILHPLEVAQLLRGRDYPDAVVAAGVLHDVLEDTPVIEQELRERFGARVADLVVAVSEPTAQGDYHTRKQALRDAVADAPGDALAVFAADKVTKTRELRLRRVASPATSPPSESDRVSHYQSCLELLERRLGCHPLVRQLRFELEALELLPPRPH